VRYITRLIIYVIIASLISFSIFVYINNEVPVERRDEVRTEIVSELYRNGYTEAYDRVKQKHNFSTFEFEITRRIRKKAYFYKSGPNLALNLDGRYTGKLIYECSKTSYWDFSRRTCYN
jgi:hypothetical protein